MSKNQRDNRVFRAEFKTWLVATSAGVRTESGQYVVEVARWDGAPNGWAAMINGDRGRVLLFANTAARAKARCREHFQIAVCDWQVGETVSGQWRPVDEAREKQLRRGA